MKMNKNPLTISYTDLIRASESRLNWMQKTYPGRVIAGTMTGDGAVRKVEEERTLLRILKRLKEERRIFGKKLLNQRGIE